MQGLHQDWVQYRHGGQGGHGAALPLCGDYQVPGIEREECGDQEVGRHAHGPQGGQDQRKGEVY